MQAHIRTATTDDIPALIRLRFAFSADFFGHQNEDEKLVAALRAYFARTIPAGSCVAHLAEVERKIVAIGILVFRDIPPSPRAPDGVEAHIFNMYTDPEHRGRGIAAEILSGLITKDRSAGCTRVGLHAAEKARPLYQRAGFKAVDSEMRLEFEAK